MLNHKFLEITHGYKGRIVAIDTESTGLHFKHGDRLTEIGCVEIINDQVTGVIYQAYVNPQKSISRATFNITGHTNEMLKDKPLFQSIAKELRHFIGNSPCLIHNSAFDIPFLNYEFSLCNIALLNNDIIDTLLIARKLFPGKKCNLDAVCQRLNIDNSIRVLHGALLDAHLLSKVYLALRYNNGQNQSFISNKLLFEEDSNHEQEKQKMDILNLKLERPTISKNLVTHEDFSKHMEIINTITKKS